MAQPEPAGKDLRPLPEGWISEYSPQYSAWYYVNTKDANPQAIWQHPLDQAGAAPPSNEPTNPDKRPLPDGWISQYNQEHKTFFYVNTKAPDPGSTVTWSHPADSQPPPTTAQSPATADVVHAPHTGDHVHAQTPASTNPPVGAGAPPTPGGTKQNPDSRPLPPGWITDYDENFKAWYYVNTHDANPAATWTHPAETHPGAAAPGHGAATSPIAPTSTTSPTGPTTSDHNPAATGPGSTPADPTKENPDKRPLPTGWVTKYDENYKTWYYVDTTKPGGPSAWVHPAESNPPAAATTPGVTSSTTLHPDPSQPHQQQAYGAPAPGQKQGLEGLLGNSAGKLVGGLFGGKGKAQMDSFANQIGSQVNKYKGSHGGGGHGQAYGTPPGGNPGYGSPGQTPGQTPGQYVPPPGGQGYPGQGQPGQPGYGPPPSGTPGGYPGQPGYGPPPGGQPYGTPSGQGGHGGGGGFGNLPGDLGKLAGKFGFKK